MTVLTLVGTSLIWPQTRQAHASTPTFLLPFKCNTVWHASTYAGHGNAVDFNAYPSDLYEPVLASASGTATVHTQTWDHDNDPNTPEELTGYGIYIDIDHGGGWKTRYAHLASTNIVDADPNTAGDQVVVGDGIGIGQLGSTGTSTAPHVHYEQLKLNVNTGSYVKKAVKIDGVTIAVGTTYTADDPAYTSTNACEDPDDDGITGGDDDCPNTAGHATANGCPDADGDGFRDDNGDDQCVGTNGSLNGCQDTDGDGLHDGEDGCPNEVGLSENEGCPLDRFVHRYQLDFDADGAEDVAFLYRTNTGDLRLRVVWGSSGNRTTKTDTTAWQFVDFGADRHIDPVGVLDFDDDGYDDVAFLYRTASNNLRLHVIWGSVGNRTTKTSTTAWELTGVTDRDFIPAGIVDFDGNGIDDVTFFYTVPSTGTLVLQTVWGSTGNRTTKTGTTPWTQTGFNDRDIIPAGIADFDGDGYDDVLAFWLTNSGNLRLRAIWGSTLQTAKHSEATLWEHVGFGANRELHPAGVLDFDNDGYEDVTVFYIAGDGSLRLRAIWGSSGRSPKSSHNTWLQSGFGTDRNIVPAGIGDLDDDGFDDVLVLYTTTSDRLRLRAIWGSTGNRTSKVSHNTVDIAPFPEERIVVPAGVNDFDDDGFTDATFFFTTATDILRHHAVWGSSGNRSSKTSTTTWQLTGFGSTDRLFNVS